MNACTHCGLPANTVVVTDLTGERPVPWSDELDLYDMSPETWSAPRVVSLDRKGRCPMCRAKQQAPILDRIAS